MVLTMKENKSKIKIYLTLLTILITGFTIYFNSLEVPFYFDDHGNIEHPSLKLDKLTLKKVKESLFEGLLKNRPISNFSFALNYYFHEYRVQGYHLVNIIIHILTASFLYLLLLNLLSIKNCNIKCRQSNYIAFFTALIWLAHPLGTQSVTYIVQRMNSMAVMFYILSLLLFVICRKNISEKKEDRNYSFITVCLVGFLLAAAFAMGSKELSATIPIMWFLIEWYFFQDLDIKWLRKSVPYLAALGIIIFLIAWCYTDGKIIQRTMQGYGGRYFTLEERLYTQLRVVVYYLSLIFYPQPDRLALDYDFPISTSLFQPINTLWSAIFLLCLLIISFITAKKDKIISFFIIWFFVGLIIESTIVPLELVYEHRTYMPSMAIIFAVIYLTCRLFKNIKPIFYLNTAILFSIIILFCSWTIQRNKVWQNPVAFWASNLKNHPNNPRCNCSMGNAFFHAGKFDKAEQFYIRAAELDPGGMPVSLSNIGQIYFDKGDLSTAIYYLEKAHSLAENDIPINMKLACYYSLNGDNDNAIKMYESVYEQEPEYSKINMALGELYLKAGKVEKALSMFNKAYPKQQDNVELLLNIARANFYLGNFDKAIKAFEDVIKNDDDNLSAYYNLAVIYSQKGELDKAMLNYAKANFIQTSMIPVSYNYGNLLLKNGELRKAEEAYRKMLEILPVLANTYNNLGLVYLESEEKEKSRFCFERALQINPDHKTAKRNLSLLDRDNSQ